MTSVTWFSPDEMLRFEAEQFDLDFVRPDDFGPLIVRVPSGFCSEDRKSKSPGQRGSAVLVVLSPHRLGQSDHQVLGPLSKLRPRLFEPSAF